MAINCKSASVEYAVNRPVLLAVYGIDTDMYYGSAVYGTDTDMYYGSAVYCIDTDICFKWP